MPNEGFFQRWSRLKTEPAVPEVEVISPPAAVAQSAPARAEQVPLPTMADAAALNAESDYSAFVARDVDAAVRRLAMKRLFADPHFNQVDGLDIFMADFNVPDPVSPAMLAALNHARSALGSIEQVIDSVAGQAPAITAAAPPPPTDDQETA